MSCLLCHSKHDDPNIKYDHNIILRKNQQIRCTCQKVLKFSYYFSHQKTKTHRLNLQRIHPNDTDVKFIEMKMKCDNSSSDTDEDKFKIKFSDW